MKEELKVIRTDLEEVIRRLGNDIQKLSGKNVLVTGGNGLIGSYFIDFIAALNDLKVLTEPCSVTSLSRSLVSPDSRLGHLLGRADVSFIVHDVKTPYPLPPGFDFIIHSAGHSAPAFFQADPLGTIDANVSGLRWLLEYAKDQPASKVLYMSSGEIYGNPPPEFLPTPETYNGNVSPISSRACYTEGKRLAETLCSIYAGKFGVAVKIVRPFIVYGPGLGLQDRRVMADFIRAGVEGRPIEMMSAGLDTRSYCYISDALYVFWKILFEGAPAEPYNVASDLEEVSVYDMAKTIHELFGIAEPVKVPVVEEVPGFIREAPNHVRPDITKIRKAFNFEPTVSLKEGLRRTINWNLARLNRPLL